MRNPFRSSVGMDALTSAVSALGENQRVAIEYSFGLNGKPAYGAGRCGDDEGLSEVTGLTVPRIRDARTRALKRLAVTLDVADVIANHVRNEQRAAWEAERYRRCYSCDTVLRLDEFGFSSKRAHGRDIECRRCKSDRAKEYWKSPAGKAASQRRNARKSTSKVRAREAGADYVRHDRQAVFIRWSYICCYCDTPATSLDHVAPISKGGADAETNLVPACQSCNSSKGAKSLAEWASTF